MTRKRFEELKSKYIEFQKGGKPHTFSDDLVYLFMQALETGGIEDEPDSQAKYSCKRRNVCNHCNKCIAKEDEPDENDEPKLIGCPFCKKGTSALTFVVSPNGYQGRYVCAAGDGGCGASGGYGLTNDEKTVKQKTADKWNTRATTPAEPEPEDCSSSCPFARTIAARIFDNIDWTGVVRNGLED